VPLFRNEFLGMAPGGSLVYSSSAAPAADGLRADALFATEVDYFAGLEGPQQVHVDLASGPDQQGLAVFRTQSRHMGRTYVVEQRISRVKHPDDLPQEVRVRATPEAVELARRSEGRTMGFLARMIQQTRVNGHANADRIAME